MQIQLNRGSIADKVQWAREHFEKQVSVGNVLSTNEMIDAIVITKARRRDPALVKIVRDAGVYEIGRTDDIVFGQERASESGHGERLHWDINVSCLDCHYK